MKKVLLVTSDFFPSTGGVANYLINLCQNLPAEKIVVVAPEVAGVVDNFKYKVVRTKFFWPLWPHWLALFWRLAKIIKRERPEVLCAGQVLPIGTVIYYLSRYFKIPYLVNAHGMDVANLLAFGGRKLFLGKGILQNAQLVTVNSEFTKKLVLQLGVAEEKVVMVYPCPNVSGQQLAVSSQAIQEKYNLKNKRILLTVGRLVKRKGQDMVIRALPSILTQFPDLVYVVAGDGENKGDLLQLVKDLNLEDKVVFLGRINDAELAEIYRAAEVFVMVARQEVPGDFEGFGMVFLEAATFGLPVVAGNSGGQAEAVLDGQTGLVVDSQNIDAIAAAIIKLLSDKILTQKLGAAGCERVAREFNWAGQAKKLEERLI